MLLIIQPEIGNSIVELDVDGELALREELLEPNFNSILADTKYSLRTTVRDGSFVIKEEIVLPKHGVIVSNYQSVDDWEDDCKPFCADIHELERLAVRMRKVAGIAPHEVHVYWREYQVLMRKLE